MAGIKPFRTSELQPYINTYDLKQSPEMVNNRVAL